jgi:hypothetical protein
VDYIASEIRLDDSELRGHGGKRDAAKRQSSRDRKDLCETNACFSSWSSFSFDEILFGTFLGYFAPMTKAFSVCQAGSFWGFELLPAAVMRIASGRLGERMMHDWAVHAARNGYALDQLKILARLLFVPDGAARRKLHQMERSIVLGVAGDTARMARTLGREDGLHLGFEELVIQRWRRCG